MNPEQKIAVLSAAGLSCGPNCMCVQELARTLEPEQVVAIGHLAARRKQNEARELATLTGEDNPLESALGGFAVMTIMTGLGGRSPHSRGSWSFDGL